MSKPASKPPSTGGINVEALRARVADERSGVTFAGILRSDGPSLGHPGWAADEIHHINYGIRMPPAGAFASASPAPGPPVPPVLINLGATALPSRVWAPPGPQCPLGMTISDGVQKVKIVAIAHAGD